MSLLRGWSLSLSLLIHPGIMSDNMRLEIGMFSFSIKGHDYIHLLNSSHGERLLLINKLYLSLSF